MKKVKVVFISLIIFVIVVETVVNLYLFINKDNIVKNFLSGYKINNLFYIFPNILYLHKIEVLSPEVKINSNDLFLSFEIPKIIKKNFVVQMLYSKDIFLEVMQIKPTTATEEDKNKLQKEINEEIFQIINSNQRI